MSFEGRVVLMSRTFENMSHNIEDEWESNKNSVPCRDRDSDSPEKLAIQSKIRSGLRMRINDCG